MGRAPAQMMLAGYAQRPDMLLQINALLADVDQRGRARHARQRAAAARLSQQGLTTTQLQTSTAKQLHQAALQDRDER